MPEPDLNLNQTEYPTYFCQNLKWTNFWVKASQKPHQVWKWQNLYIYQYPWQIGPLTLGTFWYLPKARFESLRSWQDWVEFVKLVKSGGNWQQFLIPSSFNNSQCNLEPTTSLNYKVIDFIKIDFDPVSVDFICPEVPGLDKFAPTRPDLITFDVETELEMVNQKILTKLQDLPFKVFKASKKIQYLQATTLDLNWQLVSKKPKKNQTILNHLDSELKTSNRSNLSHQNSNSTQDEASDLVSFYQENQALWQGFNERVRRYSRKIIKDYAAGQYRIITDKTEQTFEDFYQLHLATSQRQNFPTQSKEYLRQLFWQDFVQVIIIKSGSNNPQGNSQELTTESSNLLAKVDSNELSNLEKTKEPLQTKTDNFLPKSQQFESVESVFLGLVLDRTLTYLLGGNSAKALKNHLQYLLQAKALHIAYQQNCQFYDMGGWESGSGYGDFKNGYRGKLRTFFGPFDLALKPGKYQLINSLINSGKFWRSKIKTLVK